MRLVFGSDSETGKEAGFDLDKLIDTRLLIQANSGGGKSYLIRKLLEVSHGRVQQIILDSEGEFGSLREKFDYLLAGKNLEIQAVPRTAEVLARKVLELEASIIIDLYELQPQERKHFVRLFLEAMINAPKELWHPCLVVVDEAHVFCPEKGESEAADAVNSLMTRGRKRGFCGVLATQRLSKLHKDAAAEANNKLIGRTGLDIDMKRAAEELGFRTKEQEQSLRILEPGEFFAYGPAFSNSIIKVKVGGVLTTHPKAGARILDFVPPPPSDKVKAQLAKLTDIPQVVEREIHDKQSLEQEVGRLRIALRTAQMSPEELKVIQDSYFLKGQKSVEQRIGPLESTVSKLKGSLANISQQAARAAEIQAPIVRTEPIRPSPQASLPMPFPDDVRAVERPIESFSTTDDKPLRAGAMRMLRAAAQFYPSPITKSQMATLSHVSIGGGSFGTYFGELEKKGWITERGDSAEITQQGLSMAGNVPSLPTDSDQLVEMWSGNFRAGVGRMLKVLAKYYPSSVSNETLSQESQVDVSGGSYGTYLGELTRNGLAVKEDGQVKASPTLFMETVAA